MRAIHTFISTLILLSALPPLQPQARAEEDESEKEIVSESPDGKYAFLNTWAPTSKTCDLIEKVSGKVVKTVASSGEDSNRLSTEILWHPDSQRFAMMISTSRRSAGVAIYARQGSGYHEIKLPELPKADIPKKRLKPGMEHLVEIDWSRPIAWRRTALLKS